MEKKTVLVTGIGGNVGQGIIRNIRNTQYAIKVVGCNVTEFSPGNHLCDAFYVVPFAYEEAYIDVINEIIEKESVNLVIPSTDYEAYYLSKNIARIKCNVVVSDESTTKVYLDKYLSYIHHNENAIPFAKSYLPSEYIEELKDIIVKPREGRGSRGIYINPEKPTSFSDEYMIQERHQGKEITTAFYVKKDGTLHGFITLERSLENGTTNQCMVVRLHDEMIEQILNKIISNSSIRGSANLQSIIDENGDIYPFEINCRISGTNSIRSQFGFEDVKYTLQEYLYNLEPSTPQIIDGIAIRVIMDVIYPNAVNQLELKDNHAEHYIY